ncbi:MAG TPA: DUF4157 domain-containing protein, partial [Ilumatobacteraceae bacterium]|nr:DUF4157 domain-containing protein [Ilumatobacteraceae bacterium]
PDRMTVGTEWVSAAPGSLFASRDGAGPLHRRARRRVEITDGVVARTLAPGHLANGAMALPIASSRALPARVDREAVVGTADAADLSVPDLSVAGLSVADLSVAGSDVHNVPQPLLAPQSSSDATTDRSAATEPGKANKATKAAKAAKSKQSATPEHLANTAEAAEVAATPHVDLATSAVRPAIARETASETPSERAPDDAATAPATATARDGAGRYGPGPRIAATGLADAFLTELSRHRDEAPRPLPVQFASIAELIVPNRRPLLSTSAASRAALASVGKVAATVGDVIHLAEAPAASRPSAELMGVVAHELTHVAAPSAAPRFFDDDRDTPEERRAFEIGELIRRSPVLPSRAIARQTASPPGDETSNLAGGPSRAPTAITQTGPTTGSGSGTGAGSLTEQLLASRLGVTNGLVQRGSLDTVSSSGTVTSSPPNDPFTHQSGSDTGASQMPESSTQGSDPSGSSLVNIDADTFERHLRDHFDLIVDLLEDRIVAELDRRGGRFRGDF